MARKGIVKYVQLYPEELAVINDYSEPRGLSFSDGIRNIVREYGELMAGRVVVIPHPVDAQPVPVMFVNKIAE